MGSNDYSCTVHALPAGASRPILYLYCITQKMPCFLNKDMLEFRLRKYEKNQIFYFENSGFLERKESQNYVFLCLCLG